MKKLLLVFTAVALSISVFAQPSADIGIWGGSSTYWGDVKEISPMQTFNLNLGLYFRYNFNPRISLRTMFLTGNFSAEGYVEDNQWNFGKMAQDLSVMVEINYLKYIMGEKKTPVTPYILGGFGMMFFPYTLDPVKLAPINSYFTGVNQTEESVVTPTLPFGFGIKFNIGERLGVGIEYQLRKILTDKLDDLDDPLRYETENSSGENITIKYSDLIHNNDWPGYAGIHVTYKIYFSKKPCPAYDRRYW